MAKKGYADEATEVTKEKAGIGAKLKSFGRPADKKKTTAKR